MLQDQCILPLAQLGERIGEKPCPGVVGAGKRAQIEPHLRLLLRRSKHIVDLQLVGGRQLARQREVAACGGPRTGALLRLNLLPGWRRALEYNDILQRDLVERRAVTGSLHQVEQREPGQRRNLRVVVGRDPLLQHLPCLHRLSACIQQRGVLKNRTQARVSLGDLDSRLCVRTPVDQTRRPGDGNLPLSRVYGAGSWLGLDGRGRARLGGGSDLVRRRRPSAACRARVMPRRQFRLRPAFSRLVLAGRLGKQRKCHRSRTYPLLTASTAHYVPFPCAQQGNDAGQRQAIARRGDPHLKVPGERREGMRSFSTARCADTRRGVAKALKRGRDSPRQTPSSEACR